MKGLFALKSPFKKLSPIQIVALSYLIVILLGATLLYLPISQHSNLEPVTAIDALFTATSAVCVTGLVVVPTAVQWTLFGQLVIIFLIQIGGLSFIAIMTFFAALIGRKITLKNRLMVQAAFNQNSPKGMVKIVLTAIRGTLLIEGVGMVILFFSFLYQGFPWHRSLYYGFFHAISGFCNAGFDVLGTDSLMPYVGNLPINLTIMSLIVLGGLGFAVWSEVLQKIKGFLSKTKQKKVRFSVHAKLVFIATTLLITLGALYFFLAEYNNPETIGNLPLPTKILSSFFQSVTLRTAGFASINQGGLSDHSKFISSMLMLLGGSPGGTAGGMKTVTIAVILVCVLAVIRGKDKIEIFGRTIPYKSLQQALTVVCIMFLLLFSATVILAFIEEGNPTTPSYFLDLLFESASALGTVGLTTGITPHLLPASELLLSLCMFIGRLGPMTIAMALTGKLQKNTSEINLPVEDVLVG